MIGDGSFVHVKEKVPDHLPRYCPERHINGDSTFCLGWSGEESLSVTDEASAKQWWTRLVAFLLLQQRAHKLRRWPGESWAHGSAAKHQQSAEKHAKALGQNFENDLKLGKFKVVRIARGLHQGPLLKLFKEEKTVVNVWERWKRVTNKKQPCICEGSKKKKRVRFRSCYNHASHAAALVDALWNMQIAEESFWRMNKRASCCGTMNYCPLKDSTENSNSSHNQADHS